MALSVAEGSLRPLKNRFTSASESEMNDILTNISAKNTNKSTKFAVKLLKDYCVSKNRDAEFENLSPIDLAGLLKEFYVNVRQQNGEMYTRTSFLVIRQSINRHLKSPAVGKTFDIIDDAPFNIANTTFTAMCKKLRQEGKGKVTHKPTIQQGDIVKLYNHPRVFNTDIPSGLLNKVFFEVLLYFCRRGQENLRDMRPEHFEVKIDDNGKRYICKTYSELTKNHQGIETEDFEAEGGRIYATDTSICLLSSFIKYLEKRNPDCEALWQRPRDSYDDNGLWFERKPLGVNTLSKMMAEISKAASLSKIYTNHCIRATCITVLNDAGFEGRHIVTVSGHRSEESIRNYCSDTSDKQKRDMSKCISGFTTVISEQKSFDVQFDDSISENELVLSASQTEEILNTISQGKAQLELVDNHEPIVDTSSNMTCNNIIANTRSSGTSVDVSTKGNASDGRSYGGLMFHNCNVTINMCKP